MTFRFLHLDVFTDELFGGNQIAVFPNARDRIGPAPVDLERRHGRLAFAWMTQRPSTFGAPIDAAGRLRLR
jgi:predicted PhzF superfamily epimerase YddE/YHI9